MPDLDLTEKQRIQRSNQIFLRLRKELHDRDAQFAEKDVREASQSARWLREIAEQHEGDWEQAYEDALAGSDLTGEDEAYLQNEITEAGGFSSFVQRNLRRLEEAAPDEGETDDHAAGMTHQDLICGVVAGLVAGGVMMGNSFYFGFAVGMSRKASCW
ncbi:MAG: hypothetical protein LC751_01050 [Actinobacteria bacterium]|nr:hypothetical protein [Actinomycetota bacterium]MCA1737921.1 hypothetical protein [Actinomycetota bacterium]